MSKIDSVQASTSVAYGSGGAGFMLGLGINDWLAIIGIVFVILTYVTNLYFQYRRDQREQERLAHLLSDKEEDINANNGQ